MPGDNRQDYAVEVMPTLPVLIVDGDGAIHALAGHRLPSRCAAPPLRYAAELLVTRRIASAEFTPELLTKPIGREPGTVPRVLVIMNVPSIRPDQSAGD